MAYELVLANIAKHITLEEEEILYFTSIITLRQVKKKEFILQEGQLCKNISFVNTGILRAYREDREGRESTILFALEDWWITDMYCFVNQQPAMLNIVAVEDSSIFHLQKNDLDDLLLKIPKFERFFRILMQNAYIREQLRIIQNLTLSAAECYSNFLTKYPQIAASVAQKQIASYLGITPEFLSSIRANKLKQ